MIKRLSNPYNTVFSNITERITKAQYNALKAVNTELITLYWDIGKIIFEAKSENSWGTSVVENLIQDINHNNPNLRGFSKTNVFNMVRFYERYKKKPIFQTLSGKLSWSHNTLILQKCKSSKEKEYYMRMTIKYGWSYRVLKNKIAFKDFSRTRHSQNNFDQTLGKKYRNQAKLIIKDEYIFDFLELGDFHTERELEKSIISNLEKFLLEINLGFLYVGRQYKLKVGNEEFFIDLLLYHRIIKCFIAIELKIGNFKPEYVGKMSFYLTTLDKQIKRIDENKSIGIIICKDKNRTLVEYSLVDINKPMAVATYKSSSELPNEYKKYLPSEIKISELLKIRN